ncbi:hypothetical protein D9M73_102870 [compost metagenome]
MEQHPPTGRRPRHCVAQQMLDHLLQPLGVARYRTRRWQNLDGEIQFSLACQWRNHVGSGPRNRAKIDRLPFQFGGLALGLGQVEHFIHQHTKTFDRLQNRLDIARCGRGQLSGIALVEHFGETADRGERRAQLVTHRRDEGGLDPIGSLQRFIAVAQRALDATAVGNIQHREQAVAIGQGNRCKFEMSAIGETNAPAALLPLDGRGADEVRDQRRPGRVGELPRCGLGEHIDARMRREEFLLESPYQPEFVVPQLQPPIGGKHAQCLIEILEGRGAHAQQGVAGAGQLYLLGPIFENQQKAAIGQGLRHDAQMRAARQMPFLLLPAPCRQEPVASLRFPAGKVAHLGQALGFAHPFEHPVELGAVRQPFRLHREQATERLIAKDERAVGAKLDDARRKPIEHRALRIIKALQACAGLLQILDVDGKAGNAPGGQRGVVNAQHPSLTADRRGHRLRLHRSRVARQHGIAERPANARSLHQLQPARDHVFGRARFDGMNILRIDHGQSQVGPAIPHRHRCRLDDPAQVLIQRRRMADRLAKPRNFVLGVGRVENPQDNPAGCLKRLGNACATDHERARRTLHPQRARERPSGFLRGRHVCRKRGQIFRQQAGVACGQIVKVTGHDRQTQPIGQALRAFYPTIASNDHCQSRGRTEHRFQTGVFGKCARSLAPCT